MASDVELVVKTIFECIGRQLARPERFERPTPWFVVAFLHRNLLFLLTLKVPLVPTFAQFCTLFYPDSPESHQTMTP